MQIEGNQIDFIVVAWEYDEQPDWEEVDDAIRKYKTPRITMVDTGCDENAIVVGNERLPPSQARRLYFSFRDYENYN